MLQSLGHLTTAGCPISNRAKKTKKNILMIIFQNKKKLIFQLFSKNNLINYFYFIKKMKNSWKGTRLLLKK